MYRRPKGAVFAIASAMIDPAPLPNDRFWHLTSTAWTAIGSFVSAVSVFVLVAFNWRYLYWTHKLSDSATEQAAIARDSLKKLEEQIGSDLAMQRHAAIAVLRDVQSRVTFWIAHFRTEFRLGENSIQLIPDDWNLLFAFISRHLPASASNIAALSTGLRNVEGELNRLSTVSLANRGPNTSLHVRYDSLGKNLDNMLKRLKDIDDAFANKA